MTFVRSGSVVTAILAEVKPHIAKMKGARSQLQKSIDAAKVGSIGTLLEDAEAADVAVAAFNTFMVWLTLVFHTPFRDTLMMKLGTLLILMCDDLGRPLALLEMIHGIFGPLLNLRMFKHPSLLKWCTMHTINLGLLFTANGGSLILLTEELQYFGPGEFSVQLEEAYRHFLDFCRTRRIPHTQPPFLRKMVKTKNGEILMTAKAYNGRIILMWLNHCLLDAVQHHADHQILLMTSVAMFFG
ncbi:unnamed protein product [Cladocopium goreaui]|uniref:Uncharacterized protein n=1 Tax=Cladocopium goreaui TaxID=2562237 RepID=A0A9P1GK98_9DINO|nr:unnamed protein product [Cladocopium goreaui]